MAVLTEGGLTRVESPNIESTHSGVAWGAVFAGGATAAGITLILLVLGSGLGLAAVSPWAGASTTATGLAIGAVIWLIVVQWIASAIGGYTAGRLRTKWAAHYSDEVFFRDTAHGLLAWVVGTFFMVWVFASTGLTAVVGIAGGVGTAATAYTQSESGAASTGDNYFVDQLFRGSAPTGAASTESEGTTSTTAVETTPPSDAPAVAGSMPASSAAAPANAGGDFEAATREAIPIFGRAVLGTGTDADRTYLAQLVSARTGLSQADAETRVDEVVASAKEASNTARKAAATASIMTALSLLIGAFIAAVAGALGGHYRDDLAVVK